MAGNGERILKKTRCLNSSGGNEKRQEAEIVSEKTYKIMKQLKDKSLFLSLRSYLQ